MIAQHQQGLCFYSARRFAVFIAILIVTVPHHFTIAQERQPSVRTAPVRINNGFEAFGTQLMQLVGRASGYVYGSASVNTFPTGVHQPYYNFHLPAPSTLGGIGWGIRLYYGRVLFSQELARYYRLSVPEGDSTVFINRSPGGLQLSLGYSVFESGGFRLAPVIEGGLAGFATTTASPNAFLSLGGAVDISYNYPLPPLPWWIASPSRILPNGDEFSNTNVLCVVLRCGYAQNYSVITGQATHTSIFARLNIGLGFEVTYTAAPSEE
jgi:hypothetical protein